MPPEHFVKYLLLAKFNRVPASVDFAYEFSCSLFLNLYN